MVRNRLRDSVEAKDPKPLDELVAASPIGDWPVPTVRLLAFLASTGTRGLGNRVVALLIQAQQRHPDDFWINEALGISLYRTRPPRLEETVRFFSVAMALRPRSPAAHTNLGLALNDLGRLDAAVAEYREAIRLKNDDPLAHNNLGVTLRRKGEAATAIAEYREAIRLKNDYAQPHSNLGWILLGEGSFVEAIDQFRKTIHLNENYPKAHKGLGRALALSLRFEEAIAVYGTALTRDKNDSETHYWLGVVLQDSGRLDMAIAKYRDALGLKKNFPEAQRNLALTLKWKAAADRLPCILNHEAQPAGAPDCLALASFCQQPFKALYAAAARFYGQAFAEKPQLAEDLNLQHRYNAACAAALAGCGLGKDADKLDPKERARLRNQALDWLRADLKAYRQVMDKSAANAGPEIAQLMQHWLQDTDFTGVRGPVALGRLPEAERSDWQKLWEEVDELRLRATKAAQSGSPARL
jgi:Flp pilus assembly protein TadD